METNTANRILEFLRENFPRDPHVTVDTFNFGRLELTRDEAIIYTIASLDSEWSVVFDDSGGDQIVCKIERDALVITIRQQEVGDGWTEFERGRIQL